MYNFLGSFLSDCIAVLPFDGGIGQGQWMDTSCNQKRNFICEGNPSKEYLLFYTIFLSLII